MKIYPISLLMSFCFPVCLLYREFQCPSTPERRLRAKWFCQKFGLKEENYACLYDPILNEYQEKCNFKANILDPGEKYILHHRPTSAKCGNTNRYQPFGLQNFSDQCVYQRSMCSEAEQLRFNDGSVTVDKSCRCNGAQGYAFVTSPKRRCYCTPSTEDCSCYLKRCADNFTLSLDYQCIHMSNKSYQASCPGIDNQESSNIDHTTIYTENFQENSFEDLKYSRTAALFTSVGTLIMVTAFISSLLYFEKMQSIRYEQKSPSTELKAFPENGDLILTWSSQVYDKIKVNSYNIIYTSNSWISTTTISVSAEDLSCIIPDVLPMKTYRFKIASCLINGDSKLSDEHMFNSGSPSAPTQIRTLIGSGVLTLTWTSPVQNLFQVKYYKIRYTSTNEMSPTEIKVDAKTLYCNIPNILPMQTYRFKILSCLDDFDGQPSEEHMFHAGTPNPPTQLKDFIENGVLTLTWTSPIENLFQVKYYKVLYTSTKETRPAEIKVDANTLYCNIPNIRPLQTYRFKILSCVNDFDGQPSEEHMFYSGKPKQSAKLTHHFGNDRNIRLVWTAAEEILFKTESYDLEYTTDGWKTMSTFPLPASELEYEIHDFTVDATYRFKLYTVSHSERSFPTEDVCIASARYYVKIQLNGIMHHDALHDATSPLYMSLREGIEQGVNATLSDCAGDNVIAELQFSRGSLYAVFILLSQRSNDEAKLRNAFEKTIKTGKFGKFMVSMEGFIFQALDNPVPPQCVRVETEYNVINILWEKPAETFFRTAHYLLQSTTDDWKTFERISIPTDQNRYCISNVLPSTKYNFKMFTVTQNDIRSIPSNEEYIVTKVSVDCTKATPLNHDKYEITETITKKVDIVQHNHVAKHTLSNGSSTQGGLSSENTILKNKIENIRRVIISQFDHFVETRAFHEILRILNKKHYVIIKGNPGDGKTTLAYFAMRRLIDKQNKKPLQLFSYLEWNKYVSPDENLAILIDNLFGEHSVSYDNVTHWSHRFPMIKATVSDGQHSNYVIICIRNDIFNQCQEMVYNEFFNSAMVDISHGNEFALNLDEMESIFRKYIPDNKLLLSKAKLSKFLQNIPTLGFPQCCHLYKHIEKLQKKGLDFFKNPLYFLEKELNARFHAKDMKMAVLVCVLLFGGNVNRSILYDQNQNRKLKESAMTMCSVESIDFTIFQDSISNIETSFLVHDVNEDMLKFAHSSIQKAVFLVVGKHNPDDLIQNCDYTLLSLISTPQCLVKSSESIVISEKSSRILMNRILELLTRSSSTVLQVISELNVWNDIHFFQKCLDFDESFVEAVDEDECSLFVHFSAAGCIKWVEHLYNMLVNKKQLIKALEEACGSNKLEIVIFLLGKNVVPNIRCCFNAARGGYLNILIALVEANSDLCREIDKTQSRWKNASYSFTVLEEAALFNQCHLIEPLLKLCPYLTTVRSSCNTTFIHVMAVAGNVELLKRFIENKTFSPYDKSDFNSTILHFACQSNRFETVKYIIETYPDLLLPEHYCFLDGTVLHTAAQSGNVIMFQYVHQKNIDILENKHITSIRLYDKNFVYDSNSRKNQTYVEISKLLHVRDGHGLTVLHAAAWSGSIELFKYVAKKSIDFLDERFTIEIRSILKYAKMRNNNEDMVSYLKETYNGIESDELSQSDSWND